MTKRLGALTAVACSLVLLAAGCAQGGAEPGDGGGTFPLPADTVALRVSYTGGFVPPTMLLSRAPTLTVYGDGRVFTEGPVIAIYPGPALPNIQVQQISPADVDKLVDQAVAAGVGVATDFGEPGVADAPSTKFVVRTADGVKSTEVYALGEAGEDPVSGVNEQQRAARAKLRGLLTALTDLPATLGADAVSPAQPYRAAAVAAIAMPWSEDTQLPGEQQPVDWPGPALPGEKIGELGISCVTATGAEATKVLDAAQKANTATPWVSGGQRWTLTLRPLLPDESSCADLTGAR
jgi:hypothetical protein